MFSLNSKMPHRWETASWFWRYIEIRKSVWIRKQPKASQFTGHHICGRRNRM